MNTGFISPEHLHAPSAQELYAIIADLSLRVARLEARLEAERRGPRAVPATPQSAPRESAANDHAVPPVDEAPADAAPPVTVRLDRMPDEPPLPTLQLEDEPEAPVHAGPVKVEVEAELERYPRILEKIRLFWDDPRCPEFLKTLVIDERGNRAGFPPEIMVELLTLVQVSLVKFVPKVKDIWLDHAEIGDRP